MTIKKSILGVFALAALTFTACSDDDDNVSTNADLSVNITGLDELGEDYLYEGWLIVGGNPVSTGRFTSVTFPQTFSVDKTQLETATKFVLTIEPAVENEADLAAPAATKILAGDFSDDSATIWASTITTDANDFSEAAGKFFLRTPTDETDVNNTNDENGVWFGEPGAPPTAGLMLPTLAAGWQYEGWVVADGTPLSTGTFTAFDVADNSNDFSGTENNAGPPVPGEDFFLNAPEGVTFPLDVRGKTVVISIEPSPDNSAAPFTFKPLTGTAGQELAPTTHSLTENAASVTGVTGMVTR